MLSVVLGHCCVDHLVMDVPNLAKAKKKLRFGRSVTQSWAARRLCRVHMAMRKHHGLYRVVEIPLAFRRVHKVLVGSRMRVEGGEVGSRGG